METFKAAFLAKYPKCGIVLDYFREATDKPMSWGNLSRRNCPQNACLRCGGAVAIFLYFVFIYMIFSVLYRVS